MLSGPRAAGVMVGGKKEVFVLFARHWLNGPADPRLAQRTMHFDCNRFHRTELGVYGTTPGKAEFGTRLKNVRGS